MPESGWFFPGATRAVVPKPTGEANGCKLRHGPPRTLQKAQYVGFSESAQPLPIAYFGWPRFPVPGSAPRMSAGPIYGLTLPTPKMSRRLLSDIRAMTWLTSRIRDPARGTLGMEQRCNRGVPCIRLVRPRPSRLRGLRIHDRRVGYR